MLVDKYRPEKLDDIIGHEGTISELRLFIKAGDMPNLLFIGPAGTGKTATAEALAKEFGCYPNAYLELNASDERGIAVVRGIIKDFSRSKSLEKHPFKILLLDEGDELTRAAQQALRRTMERYSKSVRFIITGNNLAGIVEPIQSRCTKHYFKPLSEEQIMLLLARIAKAEKKDIPADVNRTIAGVCEGDARTALNILEGILLKTDPTPKDVIAFSGKPEEKAVWRLIELVLAKNDNALDLMNKMLSDGASPTEIMRIMYYTALKRKGKYLRILRVMGILPGQGDKYKLTGVIAGLLLE